jgi:hypothetical protein
VEDSSSIQLVFDRINRFSADGNAAAGPWLIEDLVELSGIEPLTSSLRTRRSPS